MTCAQSNVSFLVLILFSFSSFSFFKSKKRNYEDMANEISIKVAKKLCKKHQMNWVGEGGGMMHSVYMIGLSFQINHVMDQNEARMRLVDCVEELLAAINENKEIRPYLKYYPFTTEHVRVSIFSRHPDGKRVFDPDFEVASILESDDIIYSTVDYSNRLKYKSQNKEPYQKALEIVKMSENSSKK